MGCIARRGHGVDLRPGAHIAKGECSFAHRDNAISRGLESGEVPFEGAICGKQRFAGGNVDDRCIAIAAVVGNGHLVAISR